ncbi:hypothetical protein BJ878DRAFT_510016 [Calycina marina]|uniref:Uncharacterized protein n=1 Tax=Calycina marina TaxID=1763456 RepID=A0A9P7Z1E4_9HELO|nr:hypothetical protein BJ878DRAFT_510016 [Calycina marina]
MDPSKIKHEPLVSLWSPETLTRNRTSTLCAPELEMKPIDSFPTHRPAPKYLPIRTLALGPALDKLDAVHKPAPYTPPSEGKEADLTTKEGFVAFQNTWNTRAPYVQLASQRLQATMGVCNDNVFELPDSPKLLSPPGLFANYKPIHMTPLFGHCGNKQDPVGTPRVLRKKDSGISLGGQTTSVPVGIETVDKVTGKGLREFMLQKGKELGMRKRDAKDISFWDFTPDLRTSAPKEEQFVRYGVMEPGDRIDIYEIDLPTTCRDLKSGAKIHGDETWLWILIQRPVLSIDPTNYKATMPANHVPLLDSQPKAPPNFPQPNPLSWIVIAAPLAHLTIYQEATEKKPSHEADTAPTARFLKKQRSRMSFNSGHKVNKRIDYDFSHSGVPLFEFSMESAEGLFQNVKPIPFLSVEGIGSWCPSDPHDWCSKDEWLAQQAAYSRYIPELKAKNPDLYKMMLDTRPDGIFNRGFGVASPFAGLWWAEFYRGMHIDAGRWRAIRRAMARGACRVVARWTEFVKPDNENEGVEMLSKQGENLDVGPPLRLTESLPVWMSKERKLEKRKSSRLSIDDGSLPVAAKEGSVEEYFSTEGGDNNATSIAEK